MTTSASSNKIFKSVLVLLLVTSNSKIALAEINVDDLALQVGVAMSLNCLAQASPKEVLIKKDKEWADSYTELLSLEGTKSITFSENPSYSSSLPGLIELELTGENKGKWNPVNCEQLVKNTSIFLATTHRFGNLIKQLTLEISKDNDNETNFWETGKKFVIAGNEVAKSTTGKILFGAVPGSVLTIFDVMFETDTAGAWIAAYEKSSKWMADVAIGMSTFNASAIVFWDELNADLETPSNSMDAVQDDKELSSKEAFVQTLNLLYDNYISLHFKWTPPTL